jgi:hypothetical protein
MKRLDVFKESIWGTKSIDLRRHPELRKDEDALPSASE